MLMPVGLCRLRSQIWGYDARVAGEEHDRFMRWFKSVTKGDRFFLRTDLKRPLSADSAMWPSVFEYDHPPSCAHPALDPRIEADLTCTDDLWTNLPAMTRCLKAAGRPAMCVALELFVPPEATVLEVPSNRLYADCCPQTVPAGYDLLGYDITNASIFSGLCNCGYGEEEVDALLPVWGNRMNEHGLLATFEDALAYWDVTEARVGSHGPFFVCGVHGKLLPDATGGG
ncbi:MAG: hypothetical protein JNL98_37145 [Bryobacterales bacterium]|nr:hypothetical protein [Bryobacterales bacterium]